MGIDLAIKSRHIDQPLDRTDAARGAARLLVSLSLNGPGIDILSRTLARQNECGLWLRWSLAYSRHFTTSGWSSTLDDRQGRAITRAGRFRESAQLGRVSPAGVFDMAVPDDVPLRDPLSGRPPLVSRSARESSTGASSRAPFPSLGRGCPLGGLELSPGASSFKL